MWIPKNLQVSVKPLLAPPSIIKYGFIETKFGRMLLGLTADLDGAKSCNAICLFNFVQNGDQQALKEMSVRWPTAQLVHDAAVIENRNNILGITEDTATINVAVLGTDFQLAVWNELVKLKPGETCTYSKLAELVERPKAVRAVASAVARNKISVLIPCHRVVSKSGALKYHWGAELKSELLNYEKNT